MSTSSKSRINFKTPSTVVPKSSRYHWTVPKSLPSECEYVCTISDTKHLTSVDLIDGFHKFNGVTEHLSSGLGVDPNSHGVNQVQSEKERQEAEEDNNFSPGARIRAFTMPLEPTIINSNPSQILDYAAEMGLGPCLEDSGRSEGIHTYHNDNDTKEYFLHCLIHDINGSATKHSLKPNKCKNVECLGGSVICYDDELDTICHAPTTTDNCGESEGLQKEMNENELWQEGNNLSSEFIQSILDNEGIAFYKLKQFDECPNQTQMLRSIFTYRKDLTDLRASNNHDYTSDNPNIGELRENGINKFDNYTHFPFTSWEDIASNHLFYILKDEPPGSCETTGNHSDS